MLCFYSCYMHFITKRTATDKLKTLIGHPWWTQQGWQNSLWMQRWVDYTELGADGLTSFTCISKQTQHCQKLIRHSESKMCWQGAWCKKRLCIFFFYWVIYFKWHFWATKRKKKKKKVSSYPGTPPIRTPHAAASGNQFDMKESN